MGVDWSNTELAFTFSTTSAQRIADTCDVRNLASARVMEKSGLRQLECFADIDDKTGEPFESFRYVIRRHEWEAGQSKSIEI